jgi:tetratricopeptide (TPR) repeat protein
MPRYSVFVFCLFFVLLIKAGLIRADERPTADEGKSIAPSLDGMGDLNHPVTTSNEMAQRFFNQGLVLSYGFNHKEAERSFREAARLDPNCAMAYWGIALVLGPNINAAMDDEAVQPAYEATRKALELAPGASKKEQAYIQAVSKRYVDHAVEDLSSLDKAYAQAMGEVARQFPDDPDAVVLYAEALMDLHPWDFWEKDGQPKPWTPKIVATLEGALKKWSQHPGANHFYIHTVEASHQPDRAMVNADRLGSLVPGAGHLVHMPAHIYIRTGRYHDGSEANERAIESDDAYITQCRSQGIYPLAYHPHNWHFLWATASFEGRSKRAIEAARTLTTKVSQPMMREAGYGTLQHYYIIPMYALVKFGKWNEILNEPAPPEDLLYPTGVWHFARGMANTRTGQLKEAAKELEMLQTIAADTP